MPPSIDRQAIFDMLVEQIESNIEVIKRSIARHKDEVIDAQHAMQSTYDTAKIETSWLVDAHMLRLQKYTDLIKHLKRRYSARDSVSVGMDAIVAIRWLDVDSQEVEFYMISQCGGQNIPCANLEVITITATTPLGAALMGQNKGAVACFKTPLGTQKVEIVEIF